LVKVDGISREKSVENQLLVPNFIKIDTDGMNLKIIKILEIHYKGTARLFSLSIQNDIQKKLNIL
jgi:hypothetical protein